MGVGSVVGAVIGGMLVGIAPSSVLKVSLGIILMVSAFKIFRRVRSDPAKPTHTAAALLACLFLFHSCAPRGHDTQLASEPEIIVAAAADVAPAFGKYCSQRATALSSI